jgi:molybdopterin/thiamine biosynthesis adenylyltransferase
VSRKGARVLVVGVGGLGSPASVVLARAGIGTIGIADDDVVERSNLHRQILFDDADVGKPKIVAAARALDRLGTPNVVSHATRVLPSNAVDLVGRYDVVLEGSDNFATKFLVADACSIARVPVVHAAAVRWVGTALAVAAGGAPCYRCLFEDVPLGDAPNCAEAGVVGPVVGIVGALQADLALSIVDGADVYGTLVTFDGRDDAFRRRKVARRAACPLCSTRPRIRSIETVRYTSGDACEEC